MHLFSKQVTMLLFQRDAVVLYLLRSSSFFLKTYIPIHFSTKKNWKSVTYCTSLNTIRASCAIILLCTSMYGIFLENSDIIFAAASFFVLFCKYIMQFVFTKKRNWGGRRGVVECVWWASKSVVQALLNHFYRPIVIFLYLWRTLCTV